MTDSDPSDFPEVDVPLSQVDMEYLEAGQPVFKAGDGTRLVLRFDGWQDRCVPIEALEELVSGLRDKRDESTEQKNERSNMGDFEGMAHRAGKEMAYHKAADELQELIEDYE